MIAETRIDPATGSTLTLAADGLRVLHRDGRSGFVPAPPGFSLSHFGAGATVVGRSDAPVEGWRDWHFQADVAAGLLRRLGPAY
jgi:hypothetical protein